MNKVVCGRFVGFVVGLSALVGCAKVTVQRANRDSDERAGIPFYMQRPYVVLEEEIPVQGEEGYLSATFHDKQTLELRVPEALRKAMGLKEGEKSTLFPASSVARLAGPMSLVGVTQGNPEDPKKKKNPDDAQTSDDTSAVSTASGVLKWDPSVPQEMRTTKRMSIIFLPDLDEKYVASADAGIGTASLGVAMGPGNTLNQFQTNIDNREVGRFLFKQVDKFTEIAAKILAAKNKLPGAGGGGDDGAGETQGLAESPTGSIVALKYACVGIATPGMYPILKDSEYKPGNRFCPLPCETCDRYLIPAVWPYTRYSFRVRWEFALFIEDLNANSKSNSDPTKKKPAGIDGVAEFNGQFEDGIEIELGLLAGEDNSGASKARVALDAKETGPAAGGADGDLHTQWHWLAEPDEAKRLHGIYTKSKENAVKIQEAIKASVDKVVAGPSDNEEVKKAIAATAAHVKAAHMVVIVVKPEGGGGLPPPTPEPR